MDYICDTNVWYDLAAGTKNAAEIKQGGINRLLATALVAIELSSRMTADNFAKRRAAAQAVASHADEVLKDAERHFADIWGLAVEEVAFDWRNVFRAIALSKDLGDLNSGGQSIMKINTQDAEAWRTKFTQEFVANVEDTIRSIVGPEYATRRQYGRMDHLKDPDKIAELKSKLASPAYQKRQVLLTRTRAADHALVPVASAPTRAEVTVATPLLLPFVKAYLKYMEKAATVFASHKNDWMDLHCFAYLQGNRQVLTGDKKWLAIARDAGIGHLVVDLDPL